MKLKSLVIATLLLFVGSINSTNAQNIISNGYGFLNETVTATNDTFVGTWHNITDISDLFLGYTVNDSSLLKITVDYSGGDEGTAFASYTDSLFTNSGTGTYLTLQLRGYLGNAESVAAQDTAVGFINRIPGANWIRVKTYRHTNNGTKVNAVTYTAIGRYIYKR